MSKLAEFRELVGLYNNQELVQVLLPAGTKDHCAVRLYDNREFKCRIIQEKNAILGMCLIIIEPEFNPPGQHHKILICRESEQFDMRMCFYSGRNGPNNLPRIFPSS